MPRPSDLVFCWEDVNGTRSNSPSSYKNLARPLCNAQRRVLLSPILGLLHASLLSLK